MADALGYVDSEEIENRHLAKRQTKTENSEVPSPPSDDANGNALFAAITNLNDQLTTLHVALHRALPVHLFSGHSDPRSMCMLAARRAEYQASQ